MTCPQTFEELSVAQKRTRALTAAKLGGIHRDVAVALVALSEGETAITWVLDRPLYNENNCCATIVGLERGFFNSTMQVAPLTRTWLQAQGWLTASSSGGLAPGGPLGNPFKPWATMAAFEFTVAKRETAALRMYSLGPTQMHLKYVQWGSDPHKAWPVNWEKLEEMYLVGGTQSPAKTQGGENPAPAVPFLMGEPLRYLIPKRYRDDGHISKDGPIASHDRIETIQWLSFHAGNIATATKVHDGVPLFDGSKRRAYRAEWNDANAAANAIGY